MTATAAVSYFYGRISRDDAEAQLRAKGLEEGLFLLRESVAVAGNYAISICHNGGIHHYSIERQPDNMVMIPDGRKFPGPVELINHHSKFLDGFLTKPRKPCSRPADQAPMAWPDVTMLELEQILIEEAGSKKMKLNVVLGAQRQKFVSTVAKRLHLEQSWYHGNIDREQADKVIAKSGHQDGKYLVRVRDRTSFALSLSFQRATKHYKIDVRNTASGEKLAIEDGPAFDNLMDMIAHYHNKMDGLLCKLLMPCMKQGWRKKQRRLIGPGVNDNPIYSPILAQNTGIGLEDFMNIDEPEEESHGSSRAHIPLPAPPAAEMQKIYDSVPRSDDVFNLNRKDLVLTRELGGGNFGAVVLGDYICKGRTIPVAVKTLKQTEISTAESELMEEAKLMADLNNRYVIRMIGVCRSDNIMLVLELAALGPLNKFLKKSPIMTMRNITELMHQVALGMEYLESKNFVHRDLAARNVLLANEHLAKISDFGMSKAIGIGNQYYKANQAGKWPLKWYAPECLYFYKFDSKSDVWSYGVTLWEATSYGNKPYKGMKGSDIMEMLDNEQRMERPPKCTPALYEVMLKCWQRKSEDRPTFSQIAQMMASL